MNIFHAPTQGTKELNWIDPGVGSMPGVYAEADRIAKTRAERVNLVLKLEVGASVRMQGGFDLMLCSDICDLIDCFKCRLPVCPRQSPSVTSSASRRGPLWNERPDDDEVLRLLAGE